MDRDELLALYTTATEARDHAYRAYAMTLENHRVEGDTHEAYQALLGAVKVRNQIRAAILRLASQ